MEDNNNKNKYIVVGVIVVILALISVPLMRKFRAGGAVDNTANVIDAVPSGTTTFSGTITAVDTGCFADGTCSVTVDGKKVILAQYGGPAPTVPVGKLTGVDSIGDLEKKMGAFANVYAALTPEGDYTIYGNSEYFVDVVMTSDK